MFPGFRRLRGTRSRAQLLSTSPPRGRRRRSRGAAAVRGADPRRGCRQRNPAPHNLPPPFPSATPPHQGYIEDHNRPPAFCLSVVTRRRASQNLTYSKPSDGFRPASSAPPLGLQKLIPSDKEQGAQSFIIKTAYGAIVLCKCIFNMPPNTVICLFHIAHFPTIRLTAQIATRMKKKSMDAACNAIKVAYQ